jgi:hypothetical protein
MEQNTETTEETTKLPGIYVLAFYINGARICCAFRDLDWDVKQCKLLDISGEPITEEEAHYLREEFYPDLEFLRLDFTRLDKIDTITVLKFIPEDELPTCFY